MTNAACCSCSKRFECCVGKAFVRLLRRVWCRDMRNVSKKVHYRKWSLRGYHPRIQLNLVFVHDRGLWYLVIPRKCLRSRSCMSEWLCCWNVACACASTTFCILFARWLVHIELACCAVVHPCVQSSSTQRCISQLWVLEHIAIMYWNEWCQNLMSFSSCWKM